LQDRTQTRISSLSAALSSVPETTRLLAEVPQLDQIREKLAEPPLFQQQRVREIIEAEIDVSVALVN